MTKEKKIALFIILGLVLIELVFTTIMIVMNKQNNNDLYAEIWYENKIIETIDLSSVSDNTVKTIVLKEDLYIKIEYKHNSIRVIDAPCHTKECVRTNWISSINKPIICMDLHYKILLKNHNDNVDVIV